MYSAKENSALLVLQSQEQYLALLNSGLNHANGFILISGEPGTGKSTLLELWRSQLSGRQFKTAKVSDVAGPANALLTMMLADLYQSVQGFQTSQLLNHMCEFLNTQRLAQKSSVFIIDNAEYLSQQCLEVLAQLMAAMPKEDKLFHIVLCGSDTLCDKLADAQFSVIQKQINLNCLIQPLGQAETLEFINKYLESRQWQGGFNGYSNKLADIFALSSGVLSAIKKYCDLFFLSEVQKNISAQDIVFESEVLQAASHSVDSFVEKSEKKNSRIKAESISNHFTHIVFDDDSPHHAMPLAPSSVTIHKKSGINKPVFTTIAASYIMSAIIAMMLFHQQQVDENEQKNIKPLRIATIEPEARIQSDHAAAEQVSTNTESLRVDTQENNQISELVSDNVLLTAKEQQANDSALAEVKAAPPLVETVVSPENPVKQTLAQSVELPTSNIDPTPIANATEVINSPIEQIKPSRKDETASMAESKPLMLASVDTNKAKAFTVNTLNVINNPFDELALGAVLAKFEVAYQYGDLQRILNLLANDVQSNQVTGKQHLSAEYEKLFSITEMRRMNIRNVEWQVGGQEVLGEGTFKVKVRERGSNRNNTYTGNIVLRIKQENNKLLINEIHYNYSNL